MAPEMPSNGPWHASVRELRARLGTGSLGQRYRQWEQEGKDPHTEFAAWWFDIPVPAVTPEHRQFAKQLTFAERYSAADERADQGG